MILWLLLGDVIIPRFMQISGWMLWGAPQKGAACPDVTTPAPKHPLVCMRVRGFNSGPSCYSSTDGCFFFSPFFWWFSFSLNRKK